jgi:hypothetical protein
MKKGTTNPQVLAATTSVLGGVAVLPYTGSNPLYLVLPVLSISLGVIVLASAAFTYLLRKVI